MRSTLLYLAIFLFSINADGQDLSGKWRWIDKSEDRNFEIWLGKPTIGDVIFASYDFVGGHCGVYYNGGRIDCAEQTSVFLRKERDGIFTGTIISAYSDSTFEITLFYIPEKSQIKWQVVKGQGQSYFPQDAVLEK